MSMLPSKSAGANAIMTIFRRFQEAKLAGTSSSEPVDTVAGTKTQMETPLSHDTHFGSNPPPFTPGQEPSAPLTRPLAHSYVDLSSQEIGGADLLLSAEEIRHGVAAYEDQLGKLQEEQEPPASRHLKGTV